MMNSIILLGFQIIFLIMEHFAFLNGYPQMGAVLMVGVVMMFAFNLILSEIDRSRKEAKG